MSRNKRVRNNQKQDSQNLPEMKQSEIIRNKTVKNNQKQNSHKLSETKQSEIISF